MTPAPCARISGSTARMPKKTPLKLMSTACAHARGIGAGQRPDRLDDAGVVDQRVDPPEGLAGAGDRRLHLAELRDVAGHRLGLGADLAQPRGERGDAFRRAGEQQQRRPLRAIASAAAAPMPRLAPVMTTDFPESLPIARRFPRAIAFAA